MISLFLFMTQFKTCCYVCKSLENHLYFLKNYLLVIFDMIFYFSSLLLLKRVTDTSHIYQIDFYLSKKIRIVIFVM